MTAIMAAGMAIGGISPAWSQESKPRWGGWYAGGAIGYGGGEDLVQEVNGPRQYHAESRGLVVNARLGWQGQHLQWLGGVEIEGGSLGQSADETNSDVGIDSTLGAYASLAGRVGMAATPRILVFGKAGLAVANLEATVRDRATGSSASTSDITLGGVVGAGMEVALNDHWRWRGEYEYLRFRTELALPESGNGPGWDHDLDVHVMKTGFDYRF
ncbi:MAG: outer membrane beta-barrel protein [Magnetospirillum sp.]|nr:outer membrane beta-barrel protein [Magnetospirillum sp.]